MNPGEYQRMFDAEERHWWYVGLHELVLATVRREAARRGAPLRVLDAGCGTGRLLQLLRQTPGVETAEGCDCSAEALAFCDRRGLAAVALADLNWADLPPDAYDVITVVDVLYHRAIRDEPAVLRALRRALKPGGLLVRNDPACEALRSAHDVAVHTRVRYNRRQVRDLLAAAGLAPEFVTCRVAALAPLIALYRLARRAARRLPEAQTFSDVRLPHRGLNAALLALLRAENRLLGRTALPIGTSVFALARRPTD